MLFTSLKVILSTHARAIIYLLFTSFVFELYLLKRKIFTLPFILFSSSVLNYFQLTRGWVLCYLDRNTKCEQFADLLAVKRLMLKNLLFHTEKILIKSLLHSNLFQLSFTFLFYRCGRFPNRSKKQIGSKDKDVTINVMALNMESLLDDFEGYMRRTNNQTF